MACCHESWYFRRSHRVRALSSQRLIASSALR
jgi:hypothetical protein